MSLRILRSRAISVASSKRFLCTNAASAPQPSPPSAASPSRWNFLKYAVVGAIAGTTALAGYASYGSFLILFHFSHLLSLFSFFFISIFTVAIPRSQLMDSIFVRVCVWFFWPFNSELPLWYASVVIGSYWYWNDDWLVEEDFYFNSFFVGMQCAAYSVDEIDEKTRSLRESAKYAVGDGATALDVSTLTASLAFFTFNLLL